MRKLLFQTLAILAFLAAYMEGAMAQELWRARIKPYNAPVLKGYISLPLSGESIHLLQFDSTGILLNRGDIRKIKLIRSQHGTQKSISNYPVFTTKPGFYHQLFVGALAGEEEVNANFGIVNGYRFSKLLGLDLGINYDRYRNVSALPIYLQPRLYMKNGNVSIYYFAGMGYSPAWRNSENNNAYEKIDVKGGLTGHAGIAYQVNFSKSALNFALGYKLQKIRTHYKYYTPEYDGWNYTGFVKIMNMEEKRLVRRVFLTVGYTL